MDDKEILRTNVYCSCGEAIEVDEILLDGCVRCANCHKVVKVPREAFPNGVFDTGEMHALSDADDTATVLPKSADADADATADYQGAKDNSARMRARGNRKNSRLESFPTTRIHFKSHIPKDGDSNFITPESEENESGEDPISSLDDAEATKVATSDELEESGFVIASDGHSDEQSSERSDGATRGDGTFQGIDTGFELSDLEDEDSMRRLGTPAENILRADPLYRISRSRSSKRMRSNPDKGFAYGIHRIIRPHVKGGMGQVYIAYDQFLKREVALKELFERSTNDESIVRRFITEAEITAQLEHPGVVPIHSLGLDINGNPYYTMKLIRGITLLEAIKKYHKDPSPIELKKLIRRLVSVCQTMAFVHRKGVIHRDLKPANVMLSDNGETLIMDWGIAKSISEHQPTDEMPLNDGQVHNYDRPELTLAGTIVGTPAFMSPEQAEPDKFAVGPRSDIFSLGGILFFLLTCRNAYASKSSRETLRKLKTEPVPRPSLFAKNVPFGLEAICLKAMQRDADKRYQNSEDMVDDLCNWLDGEAISAMKESFSDKLNRLMRRHQQFSGRYIIGILVLVFILVLGAGFFGAAWGRGSLEQEQQQFLDGRLNAIAKSEAATEQDLARTRERILIQERNLSEPGISFEEKAEATAKLEELRKQELTFEADRQSLNDRKEEILSLKDGK